MKKIITSLLFFFPAMLFAQEKTNIKFTNITSVAILTSKTQHGFTVQTINGVSLKKMDIGIGVGYDDYGYSSIPAFLDIRKKIGRSACKMLLYADGGFNFPIRSNAFPRKWNDGNEAYKFCTTLFGEAGIGISNRINKKVTINFTAGFSYKHFRYIEYSQAWYSLPNLYSSGNATYDYYYRRLSLKLGLQF